MKTMLTLSFAIGLTTLFNLLYLAWLIPPDRNRALRADPLDPTILSKTLRGQQQVFTERNASDRPKELQFLQGDKLLQKLESQVKEKLNGTTVVSCQRIVYDVDKAVIKDGCRGSRLRLVVYNPAPYQRILCGKTLRAKGVSSITGPCSQAARLSRTDPTVDGTGMPAIHVGNYNSLQVPKRQRKKGMPFKCDVPCESSIPGGGIMSKFGVEGTDWKITFSMEGSDYYPNLKIDDMAYQKDSYYATTSFQSEIPLPYFSWAEYNISDPAVEYDSVIHGASFIARNCASNSGREGVVSELMNHTRVDSLSSCVHNAQPPKGLDLSDKKALMREYLFHLAFENSNIDDYVTEKLWGVLESGTLPVYYGAPNIKEHAPPNSIISRHDFQSNKDLAIYLNKVAANKTLYESYHEWRKKPLPESFRRKFNFTHTHSVCRMCRWAYAKKYGLGWDHDNQSVRDLVISRNVTHGADGRIIHPFRESWLDDSGGDTLAGWNRTVWTHDGVIDLHFETRSLTRQVYCMETNIRGLFSRLESNHFVLQNTQSRMTILTSWDATVASPQPGTFYITLDVIGVLRVRLIVEDVDTFHKNADNVTSYFGDFMTKDFFMPTELFMVEGDNAVTTTTPK